MVGTAAPLNPQYTKATPGIFHTLRFFKLRDDFPSACRVPSDEISKESDQGENTDHDKPRQADIVYLGIDKVDNSWGKGLTQHTATHHQNGPGRPAFCFVVIISVERVAQGDHRYVYKGEKEPEQNVQQDKPCRFEVERHVQVCKHQDDYDGQGKKAADHEGPPAPIFRLTVVRPKTDHRIVDSIP